MNSNTLYPPGEGHKVMLAHAVDLSVLDNDHFMMSLAEASIVDDALDIKLLTLG